MDTQAIIQMFDKRIKDTLEGKIKNTVLNFLLKHERKPRVIQNVLQQIRIAELDPRIDFQKPQLEQIVYTVADMFAKNAITQKEHELVTAAEKARMIDEANKMEQFKAEQEADEKEFLESQTKTTVYMND